MSGIYPADTIAAIATAPGEGAIAIVRISGPDAFALADRIFRCAPPPPSERPAGTFLRGQVVEPATGQILDQALLLVFRAPQSYTGEDGVEIHCHGGTQTTRRILETLLANGARQAEPGEFTKRAFLNGKMNLTQAEAVADLIHARSERAARLASAQLDNHLGRKLLELHSELVAVAADIEAMLDFPDDELPQTVVGEIRRRLSAISNDIQVFLGTRREGRVLREGIKIVIAGVPNVGKSTLLNRLTGRERAIVSPHPGTTRDTIEEAITLQGYPLQLIDTAGLRKNAEEVEQEGIRRARKAMDEADVCIFIVDASQELSDDEKQFLKARSPQNTLILGNKTDLGSQIGPQNVPNHQFLPVSLKFDPNIDQITAKILEIVLDHPAGSEHSALAISNRHYNSLLIAQEEVESSIRCLQSEVEAEYILAATHARAALEPIGQLLGKTYTEEVLSAIFSRFCVGK
jgi:tRNA modification GTPase